MLALCCRLDHYIPTLSQHRLHAVHYLLIAAKPTGALTPAGPAFAHLPDRCIVLVVSSRLDTLFVSPICKRKPCNAWRHLSTA